MDRRFRSIFGGQEGSPQPGPPQPSSSPVSPRAAGLNPLSQAHGHGSQRMGGAVPGAAGFPQPPLAQPQPAYPAVPLPGVPAAAPVPLTSPTRVPIRKDFPELSSLSAEELRVLLTDPEAYSKFLHNIEEIRQLDAVVDDLQKSNLELAKSTLSMEGAISELQTQCRIIRGTELASAREQLQQLLTRQQEIQSRLGPQALLARLQEAANEANRDSDALQVRLSAGEIDISQFIREYRAKRKLYHTRHQTGLAALASLTSQPGQ